MDKKSDTLCRGIIVLCAIVAITAPSLSQGIYDEYMQRANTGNVMAYDLFERSSDPGPRDTYFQHLNAFNYLKLNSEGISALLSDQPELISIEVPLERGLTLSLYRAELFGGNYRLRSSDRIDHQSAQMIFYHGFVEGNANSLCAVSIVGDEIRVMYTTGRGNFRIQKSRDGRYLHFADDSRIEPLGYECNVTDAQVRSGIDKGIKHQTRSTGSCVDIYFECDVDSYYKNDSSVSNTEGWVAQIFNEVAILYTNENIPIVISEIFVWTTTDPYAGLNSTGDMLSEFVQQIATNDYNGRLAHLLSTRNVGGGIAYVDVLCSNSVPCAVSGSLDTDVVPFPQYSWNVTVVAHELGHNFGSRHTHRCTWNGNNTQIDDCGNEWSSNPEGASCYDETDPILPANGGTIMSYCHLISGVGINFNNGFGPQPGQLIYDNYITAPCSTGDCFAPECTVLSSPLNAATDIDINSDISWENIPSANGYRLDAGTTPGGIDLANALDVGNTTTWDPGPLPYDQDIYVTVLPYNGIGDASGCNEESFRTEEDITPACTQLVFPENGAVNVDINTALQWEHSVGAQTTYLLNIGLTPGGGEILNDVSVGNVTSYTPGDLPFDTTIYVQVIPASGSGPVPGCAILNFSTEPGLAGDVCSGARSISCGETVQGNTSDAQEDDVANCGTSISAPGIWFTFPGVGDNVTLSMCGAAAYNSKLSVYRGSCQQLICVAGNDDTPGCSATSAVEISTLSDVTYYVLVHGREGQTGTFNLTMACSDPPLCPSQSVLSDEEWIAQVSVGDFVNASGEDNYSDFTNLSIPVASGNSYSISLTPAYSGQEYNEYFQVWADFNNDGDFEDSGESLFTAGPVQAEVSGTIEIPASAAPGNYLLRIGMKYNALPDACEVFTYGEVEEYTLAVRDCRIVTNTQDSGVGSLRNAIACAQPGDTITFSNDLSNADITITTAININKSIVIAGPEQGNLSVVGEGANRILSITSGSEVLLSNIKVVGGTASEGSAVRNFGALTLRDVTIDKPPLATDINLVENYGELFLLGNCEIRDQ